MMMMANSSGMSHGAHAHSVMDHSAMHHSMNHSIMNHTNMDHGGMSHGSHVVETSVGDACSNMNMHGMSVRIDPGPSHVES